VSDQPVHLSPGGPPSTVLPAEDPAALAAIEAEDDTINRGLLLKFLGAVDG